ncbi:MULTISPECIES: hypothetical protein [Stenotrophomonas]|uniref:hypothetical protein n=1 Tax=Stenotrophomonas TaxID=40323 RepID=UPI00083FA78A|nr:MULTISPECIES: hypothetical protein [Stenotrophomonas]MBN5091714.1 hypothetical protein [Stenotrophomonas maltophilia]MDQ7301815.1 hypothetical protein [Stenotrophomonas sp. Sm0581]PJL03983.1 hypothetical protein B9Y57_08770 [Stenotrophomonas maltophilia]PJL30580.1 hypothetical protein B9Y65_08770 [Stenotrophomonas maltophilia]PJL69282.1 hypothetical protein B9Y85_01875 [Stenotrophomonas maltophilia]
MEPPIDFYARYQMPNGSYIYGAAAANRRVKEAGGFNQFAYELVMAGVRIGYDNALRKNRK